jgi:hypothetical protein
MGLFFALALQAAASELPTDLAHDAAPEVTEAVRLAFKDGKKSSGRGGGKKRKTGWDVDWYVAPSAGVNVIGTGTGTTTVFSVGGEAGLNHFYRTGDLPEWGGHSRVAVQQQISTGGTGTDVRVGSFMGPHWEHFGIEAGPDLFWNRWMVGGFNLDPTFGVDVPITATARLDPLTAYAGVAPAWLSNPDRRVDWSKQPVPGFGHEFTYFAGASLRIDKANVGLTYQYRITTAGPQQTIAFNADIAGYFSGPATK